MNYIVEPHGRVRPVQYFCCVALWAEQIARSEHNSVLTMLKSYKTWITITLSMLKFDHFGNLACILRLKKGIYTHRQTRFKDKYNDRSPNKFMYIRRLGSLI